MSLARRLILERLHAFRLATQTEALVSLAPTEVDHNARAQVLRNGLAVVGFAILEDFIKSRAGEVVQRIGHGAAAFTDLPEGRKAQSPLPGLIPKGMRSPNPS